MSNAKTLATLPVATQQQVTAEVLEMLKAKYGTKLQVEVSPEEIQTFISGTMIPVEELDNILNRIL